MTPSGSLHKFPFLSGVFLISFSSLLFQILQTRIMSVMTWYYLAFFAISVAMLGMTVGAVWVYLWRERFQSEQLPITLSKFALITAFSMPASIVVQFCLITSPALTLTTVVAWALLLSAMAVPYVFAGVVVSLALTRSPFPTGLVYGADLVGAALGCIAVMGLLNVVDGPTAVIVAGAMSALASMAFAASSGARYMVGSTSRPLWERPAALTAALLAVALFNAASPVGFSPILTKGYIDFQGKIGKFEKWNSYSRIRATRLATASPILWGPSPHLPPETRVSQAYLDIDGSASTCIFHYDGTLNSISFLQYDLVNLAYRLPGIHKSAVIGVGGGRDILAAHLFGVADITGVELNPIFIDLLTRQPYYKNFSNITALPDLKLHVDDARSWFASTHEKFDLVQMSMIDTWASTGAGAFSLSENGLYTLEGWHAFLKSINSNGIFTVSRWYNPSNVDETGRMVGLATAALFDDGVSDVRPYLFVASDGKIATLVLSKSPFTPVQLRILHDTVRDGGFTELLSPDRPPDSSLLRQIVASQDLASLNRVLSSTYLDLTVPTDNRPFFFNQMRFFDLPGTRTILARWMNGEAQIGTLGGNMIVFAVLLLILLISSVAIVLTILVPLRSAARQCSRSLAVAGSLYFSLIGMGFMLAEIALLQYFSVYLGHPIYSLGVCLFSLILSTGLGSLASDQLRLNTKTKLFVWGALATACLAVMAWILPFVFHATTDRDRLVRIGISLLAIMPLGFLLGFAFPTGLRLVNAIDDQPTPWFWGINGATGVLASVLGVMISIAFGINVTMTVAAACYLLVIPASFALLAMRPRSAPQPA
ncbi:MAG: hypothetical protein WAL75_06900 [Terracidiphilus sp.]